MAGRKVLAAMSGGVDSSVAAAILVRSGYEVAGVTLQIWPEGAESEGEGCCSLDAVEDARRVASLLGIPHYVMNMREEFERTVIADFVDEYSRGRTPNPCIRCNQHIKFSTLIRRAKAVGADFIATGHYSRVEQGADGLLRLLRAVDSSKDQSYVLYMLGQQELAHTLFPLGGLRKEETRRLAHEMGLAVWRKADSQEICFVGKGGYRAFLNQRRPELAVEGPIVDLDGRRLGTHGGFSGFTLGQRKGVGIAAAEPLYVVDVIPQTNTVVVGPQWALMASRITFGGAHWVDGRGPEGEIAVTIKVRYNMRDIPAIIRPLHGGLWEAEFASPERAPTPGQAAVVFRGDTVLGGGTIEGVVRARESAK